MKSANWYLKGTGNKKPTYLSKRNFINTESDENKNKTVTLLSLKMIYVNQLNTQQEPA